MEMEKSEKSENPIKLTESKKPEKPNKCKCKCNGTLSMIFFFGLFVLIIVAILLPILLIHGKNNGGVSDYNGYDDYGGGGYYDPFVVYNFGSGNYPSKDRQNMTLTDVVTQNDTKNDTTLTYNGWIIKDDFKKTIN